MKTNERARSEIRKGAKQASIATIGVINDDYYFFEKAPAGNPPPAGKGTLYFPVITTAAKISVLDISSGQINANGLIPNVDNIDRKEVPWTIYRARSKAHKLESVKEAADYLKQNLYIKGKKSLSKIVDEYNFMKYTKGNDELWFQN